MSELRDKIEEAWWKLDATGIRGKEMMPTPKEHLNLLGDKQKYLDAAIEAVKAHIEGCERPENPHGADYNYMFAGEAAKYDAFNEGIEALCKALMESL